LKRWTFQPAQVDKRPVALKILLGIGLAALLKNGRSEVCVTTFRSQAVTKVLDSVLKAHSQSSTSGKLRIYGIDPD